MKTRAPYGSWRSPISVEQRNAEGGRAALVRDGVELTPKTFNARTRVHEYGGGAVWCGGGAIFASRFDNGRVYRVENGEVSPVTPEPPEPERASVRGRRR